MPIVIKKRAPNAANEPDDARARAPSAATTNAEDRAAKWQEAAERVNGISRATAAAILGVTPRTLYNRDSTNFGPKRFNRSAGRYGYKRSECEAWVAEHGRGFRQPRRSDRKLEP